MLLSEIQDPVSGLLDMNVFSDLVDMFIYLPNKERVYD